MAAVIVAFLIGGAFDWRENRAIEFALNSQTQFDEGTVSWIRDSAILKFSSLLIGFVGAFVILAAAIRRTVAAVGRIVASLRRIAESNTSRRAALGSMSTAVRSRLTQAHTQTASTAMPFKGLVDLEARQIWAYNRPPDDPRVEVHQAADEPRVAFRAADVVGLSLSGGGIRSSTFNLGLLQGLHHQHLLPLFDYLSTVSGGGYIGAYWSDWISRKPQIKTGDFLFPTPRGRADRIDSQSERHLREFSRFLAPRWGFFEVETWTAIVAVLAGLIPALAIGLSVIGLAIVGWLTLLLPLSFDTRNYPVPITIAAVTLIVLLVFELLWFNVKTDSSASPNDTRFARWLRWGACARSYCGWPRGHHPLVTAARLRNVSPRARRILGTIASEMGLGLDSWWVLMGIEKPESVVILSPHVFDYSLAWVGTAVVLLILRVGVPLGLCPFSPPAIASFDRAVMRLLGLGVLWAIIAVIWHAVVNIDRVADAAIAAVASGGRCRVAKLDWGEPAKVRWRRVPDAVETLCPAGPGLCDLDSSRNRHGPSPDQTRRHEFDSLVAWATGAMMFVAAVGLFIEPSRFGLHAFYRERLNRAFTGSHIADARDNRGTEPRDLDDRNL